MVGVISHNMGACALNRCCRSGLRWRSCLFILLSCDSRTVHATLQFLRQIRTEWTTNLTSTTTTVPLAEEISHQPQSRASGTNRIESIDIFRGLTVIVMVFVNDLSGAKGLPWWTYHMPENANGMTYVDMVFPAFLFIVGMSIPLAIGRRLAKGQSLAKIWGHILVRSLSLMALGLFLANAENADSKWM